MSPIPAHHQLDKQKHMFIEIYGFLYFFIYKVIQYKFSFRSVLIHQFSLCICELKKKKNAVLLFCLWLFQFWPQTGLYREDFFPSFSNKRSHIIKKVDDKH